MTLLDGKLWTIIIRMNFRCTHLTAPIAKLLPSPTAMNFRFSTITAALGCVLLASCYPYDESRDRKQHPKPPQKTTATTTEQQKIQEQRDKLKAEDEQKKTEVTRSMPPPEPLGN